jgi:hypothetical protein
MKLHRAIEIIMCNALLSPDKSEMCEILNTYFEQCAILNFPNLTKVSET